MEKPINCFHKNKAKPDGVDQMCAKCRNAYKKGRYTKKTTARSNKTMQSLDISGFFVYRFTDECGRVVYVGSTGKLNARMKVHSRKSEFWMGSNKLHLYKAEDKFDMMITEIVETNYSRPEFDKVKAYGRMFIDFDRPDFIDAGFIRDL